MQKMIHNTEGMSLFTQWALALQHLLAVFTGTLIVPTITGMPVEVTLLFAGISTLMFQFFTRSKIPLFYSCSFVFVGGMMVIRDACIARGMSASMASCYAAFGIFVSGMVYIILGQILRYVPYRQIMKLFPPVLSGSYIMALGIVMFDAAINTIGSEWGVAIIAIAVTMLSQFFFRGAMKLIPINIGILAATAVSMVLGDGIDLAEFYNTPWIAQPFNRDYMAFTVFEHIDGEMMSLSIFTILPLVLVSVVEHLSDILAVSRTTKIDYIRTVGLPRTLSANGLSTMLSAMFGAPATTSFSQTTGLIGLNRVCDTRPLRFAAIMMILLAFSPKMAALLKAIPVAAIGGVTLLMYIIIIVVGVRTMTDSKIKLLKPRNMLVMGVVLGLVVIIKFGFNDCVTLFGLSLSSLTVAGLTGTILNIILPNEKVS